MENDTFGIMKTRMFKVIIIISIIILILAEKNIIYCGTTNIISSTESIAELINNMNEQELILLRENLQPDHRHFQEQILQAQQPMQDTQSKIRWASVGLFITGMVLLWFISQ